MAMRAVFVLPTGREQVVLMKLVKYLPKPERGREELEFVTRAAFCGISTSIEANFKLPRDLTKPGDGREVSRCECHESLLTALREKMFPGEEEDFPSSLEQPSSASFCPPFGY